ncbi:unnamed protein product, partial [Trichogramma brassicae]
MFDQTRVREAPDDGAKSRAQVPTPEKRAMFGVDFEARLMEYDLGPRPYAV